MKKPWAFIRVCYMNPTIFGVIGPGFLNQVPTFCGFIGARLQSPNNAKAIASPKPAYAECAGS